MSIQRYDMKLYTNEYGEVDYHVDKVEEGRFVRYFDYKVLEHKYYDLESEYNKLLDNYKDLNDIYLDSLPPII